MKKVVKKIIAYIIIMGVLVMNINFSAILVKAEKNNNMNAITENIKTEGSMIAKADSGNIDIDASNSFGEMLSDILKQETDSKKNCYIADLIMEDNNAKISYVTEYDCNLVIAIYTEDGTQMLTSKTVGILASANEVKISFVGENLPEYYLIKGYLLDKKRNMPLGKSYENDHYTRNFQEFLKKTINDFKKEQILNFDNSKLTNFAVFKEETVQIKETENSNIAISVDMEKNIYVIDKATEEVKELKQGDLLYYQNDIYELMVKVKNIEKNEDIITIIAEDTRLDEIFDYIKIESEVGKSTEIKVDNSNLNDGTIYHGATKEKPDFSMKKAVKAKNIETSTKIGTDWYTYKLEKEFNTGAGSDNEENIGKKIIAGMELGFSLEGEVNVYYSKSENEKKLEINVALKPKAVAEITCNGAFEYNLNLGNFAISPISEITINFTPSIVLKTEDKLNASADISWKTGSSWDISKGFINRTENPIVDVELNTDAAIFFGIGLKPTIKILGEKIAEVSFNIEGGFETKKKKELEKNVNLLEIPKEEHFCDNCVTGDVIFKEKVSMEAKINLLSEKVNEIKLLIESNKKLADFYYSFTFQEFGLGNCQHKNYLLWVKVFDTENKPLELKEVIITGGTFSEPKIAKTNISGEVIEYLPKGEYTVSVKNWDNQDDIIEIADVTNGSCELMIQQTKQLTKRPVNIKAFDAYKKPLAGVKITIIEENSQKEFSVNTEQDGKAYINLQDGKYKISMLDWDGKEIIAKNLIISGKAVEIYLMQTEKPTIPDEMEQDEFDENAHGEIKNSGHCGSANKIFWKLYEDEMLYIYGEGNMNDYIGYYQDYSKNYQTATRIWIEDRVTSIGQSAFSGCENVTNIRIPEEVTSIGAIAFLSCSSLASIKIPKKVTNIGYAAFFGCSSLTSIEIPDGVTKIEDNIFGSCTSLKSIKIPKGITSIGYGVFSYCSSLTNIEIPEKVTSIGANAFLDCSSLTNLRIPKGVTSIEKYTFHGCGGLINLELPEGITNIGENAFSYCRRLTNIKLPKGIISIGDEAFYYCENLTSIEFPEEITDIGKDVFSYCYKLTIYAPSNSYIQSYAENHDIPFIAINTLETVASNISYSNINGKVSKLSNKKIRNVDKKVVTRKNVISGEEYVLLVIKNKDEKEFLSTENLLYIDQKTADDNSITFSYTSEKIMENGIELILGAAACNIKELENILNDCGKGTYTQNSIYKAEEDLKYAIRFVYGIFIPNSQEEVDELVVRLEKMLDIFISFKKGDVDNNNKVDVNDALIVLKIAASLITSIEEQNRAADIDGNGTINSGDALLILKYAAGLITEF